MTLVGSEQANFKLHNKMQSQGLDLGDNSPPTLSDPGFLFIPAHQ